MRLTLKECRLARIALRRVIADFSSEQDFNAEDWPAEKAIQDSLKELLGKLERGAQ